MKASSGKEPRGSVAQENTHTEQVHFSSSLDVSLPSQSPGVFQFD